MKSYEIQFMDLQRVLLGEVPAGFILEAILRIFFLFILIIISMRLLGRRMTSSINRNDVAAMVSIAAAIGVPLQDPSKGLLPALIIAIVIVGSIRILNTWVYNSKTLENRLQGNFSILIQDGVINIRNLIDQRISHERLYAQLRSEKLESLGQIKRVYLESSGSYSVLKADETKPGLSVLPDWDKDFMEPSRISSNVYACHRCGWINENKRISVCPNCNSKHWVNAILPF